MAKRNTRGRPRKERDLESRRTYRSKAERDRIFQQRALLVAGVAVLVIVGILGCSSHTRICLAATINYYHRETVSKSRQVTTKNGCGQNAGIRPTKSGNLFSNQQLFGGQFQEGQNPFTQQINILLGRNA